MRVLFLYTELAAYFVKCCEALMKNAEVHILRWPVNTEAPFLFDFPSGLHVYDKKKYNKHELVKLVETISPSMIVCSGWIDKDYLQITRRWYNRIPTVLALDTHWRGSVKQQLARIFSGFFLRNRFSHAWVPGTPQVEYARRLGFKNAAIRTGFYCCDLERFNSCFNLQLPAKEQTFPRRFIYAGRYYDFKGITDLWEAFAGLSEKERRGWELWCVGTGGIEPKKHSAIKHLGFVQPHEMGQMLQQTGVFVLPSRFEPWGVVVQEFAAAGFPLLLSNKVGAASAFLNEGKNGYVFTAGQVPELRQLLKKIIALSDKELILMGKNSHTTAQNNSPAMWAETATSIYEEWNKK